MKLAIAVQRYGADINGGAELHAFNRYSEWIFNNAHSRDDEMEWLRQQGPWGPPLLEYIERNQHQYDVLIFFTYLYAPTVVGAKIAPHKSILVPTAHDEPAIHLDIYKELFSLPAGLAYNTEVERRFLTTHFSIRAIEEETIGCGVDLPHAQEYPREHTPRPGEADDATDDQAVVDDPSPTWRPHLAHRGTMMPRPTTRPRPRQIISPRSTRVITFENTTPC